MTIAEDFAAFWAHCPLKVGKLAAEREYAKVRARGVSHDVLVAGMDGYVLSKPPHIPYCHPRTWLHQGRWMDERTEAEMRAASFCRWYADTHERLFGVSYMGSRSDYDTAQRLMAQFTDIELHEAALVWFGMRDAFANDGTRTIPKFACRATYCVEQARKVKVEV